MIAPMNTLKNCALRIAGWFLCIPAILLGPLAKLTKADVSRPWVDGLFYNTWRAYKKYDTKSWLRRMISIYHNPNLTIQYWNILTTKKKVVLVGETRLSVDTLRSAHDIQTDHAHHRHRVNQAKSGTIPVSNYGSIIVVGNTVHDGNHRIGALQEASYVCPVPVMKWEEVQNLLAQ